MSGLRIGIFTATMTGLAEVCAEEIDAALSQAGCEVTREVMDGLGAGAIDPVDVVVVVSSTYGHGDIPDNGQAFYAALEGCGSLAGKRFAVFGLGDRTYADTFCHAGEKWDALFFALGAKRVTPLRRHDASSGTLAEDDAGAWAAEWAPTLTKPAPAGESVMATFAAEA
jgi:MioC protein